MAAAKKKSRGNSYDLKSPLDGEVISRFPVESPKSVEEKMIRQKAAAKAFSRTELSHRMAMLKKIRKEFITQSEEMVKRVRRESGKPIPEIYGGEIIANVELIDFYLKHAPKILAPERVPINALNYPKKKGFIHHYPLGVIGVLSSWNYPVALAMRAIVPAIAAGNAVAFKPSDQASSTGELLAQIFRKHLPEGVFEVYYGHRDTNKAIIDLADKINFIGSVNTGKSVAAQCGENLIPCSTELSGKDAAIVLADANFERAVNGVIWGAFTNSGQNCASIERVFVQQEIAEAFISEIVKRVERLRLDQDIGPLKNENQMKLVESHVRAAAGAKKAKILTGGKRVKGTLFFEPTVIRVEDPSLVFMKEETFGPTLPIVVIRDLEQGIALANDCQFGLTASIWTENIAMAEAKALELETGVITINNCVFTGALTSAPWGGTKYTGTGVTNSKYGLLEMTRPKFVLTDRNKADKEPWWYPYGAEVVRLMKLLLGAHAGKVFNYLRVLPLLQKVLKVKI